MSSSTRSKIFWTIFIVIKIVLISYTIYYIHHKPSEVKPTANYSKVKPAAIYSEVKPTANYSEVKPTANITWDFLLFVEQWPPTYCLEWQEKDEKNKCRFPPNMYGWTIHGIWPTRKGEESPNYCEPSKPFNKTALDPLLSNLTAEWTEIEDGVSPYKFWKHEWKKHGSCAAQLESLNTEVKYFTQALTWLRAYNMSEILSTNAVRPTENYDQAYNVTDFWFAVKQKTSKNPYISCIVEKGTKRVFLSEIYICFAPDLNLTDCNGVRAKSRYVGDIELLTNCPINKPIIFPAKISHHNDTISYPSSSCSHLLPRSWRSSSVYICLFLAFFYVNNLFY